MKLRNPYRYIGFNDIWLRLIGIPVVAFLLPILFFNVSPISNLDYYIDVYSSALFYTALYWHVDLLIVSYFRKRFPSLHQYRKRLLWQSSIILVFTLSLCTISFYLKAIFIPDSDLSFIYSGFKFDRVTYASLTTTVVILTLYESIYAFSKWKSSLIESEKLKKENTIAQLETLKNQVNPHFLFNSLNTLAHLIPEDSELAVKFVQKLSSVYRYILEIKEKELIPLRQELECIRAYQFLLGIRFGDNLIMNINIPESKQEDFIVPLSLQILIENAIKHNVVSSSKPLSIEIGLDKNGDIVVTNNLQVKRQESESTKTGLANIRRRYRILTQKMVQVIETAEHFRVVIPVIQIEHYANSNH